MKLYIDTEFIEDGKTIELLSIGMVRDDDKEFYAEAAWTDITRANEWVRKHVIPHLQGGDTLLTNRQMREAILEFVGPAPEFWGYFPSYDWVVLCQLWGTMMDLPSTWPQRINDIVQYAEHLGISKVPGQTGIEHHALADARWTRDVHKWLDGWRRR